MSQVNPTVRYLIVCEDVQTDASNPKRLSLLGLISAFRPVDDQQYPLIADDFSVFLQLTECRGSGNGRIEIQNADSSEVVFRTQTHAMQFGNDPLEVLGFTFRIGDAVFREPGMYWTQFWYNEQMLAQHPLLLR